ncbi:DUF305 domain-containing protein [Candidatus Nanohaloarchaea archaeon]|nr:DUF305 domain-containing protein [Candidatus Nanohaloarchaea archaeon]
MKLRESLKDNRRKVAVTALIAGAALIFLVAFFVPLNNAPAKNSSETGFNRADLMFMNMMIIHHDQAIEMAELAPNRTDNENILELSRNISEAQRAENEQMAEWLRELGYQRPVRGHRMAGMASQEEMQRLKNSSGRGFDRLFSELMIRHHRGGIQMAQAFSRRGSYPELIQMEKQMIEAQQKEIQLMQEWQQNWN